MATVYVVAYRMHISFKSIVAVFVRTISCIYPFIAHVMSGASSAEVGIDAWGWELIRTI